MTVAMWCVGLPGAHACSAGNTAELTACIAGNDSVIDLMGGAIFVMDGGSLTLGGNTEVRGNSVSAGASGGGVAQAGSAFGSRIVQGPTRAGRTWRAMPPER